MRSFFYEPLRVRTPAAFGRTLASGTASLVGGAVGGAVGGVTLMVSAASRHVGTMANALTFDAQYQLRRQLVQQQHAIHFGHGLRLGLQVLTDGVLSGLTGVVGRPLRGAMDDGVVGFALGIGAGIFGLVTKPISGIAGGLAVITEGLARDAKRVALVGRAGKAAMRMRQPRVIGAGGVLLRYPKTPLLLPPGATRLGAAPLLALDLAPVAEEAAAVLLALPSPPLAEVEDVEVNVEEPGHEREADARRDA